MKHEDLKNLRQGLNPLPVSITDNAQRLGINLEDSTMTMQEYITRKDKINKAYLEGLATYEECLASIINLARQLAHSVQKERT
jgi:hypothetical protein